VAAVNVNDVNRAVRASVWSRLRTEGFEARTARSAWRYWDGGVDVVDVQSIGPEWDAVGCTSYSFSAHASAWPDYFRDEGTPPIGKDGRPRPHYWNCPLTFHLNKTISQPWFQAFTGDPNRPMTDAARKHREGLRAVMRADVHDRPDIWFILEDGSNLDEAVADLLQVLLATLPDLAALRDPCVASARLKAGEFANPVSLHGYELIEAADAACEGESG
jgi:hypothetical protein